MLFPTKLTSLINKQGLIDSASLKIVTIADVTVGATSDLKLFEDGVYIYTYLFLGIDTRNANHARETAPTINC